MDDRKKHKRKAPVDEDMLSCPSCRFETTMAAAYEAHVNSEEHLRVVSPKKARCTVIEDQQADAQEVTLGSVDLGALAAQLNVEQESTQQELDLGELQRILAVTLNSTEPAEIRLQLTTFEQWATWYQSGKKILPPELGQSGVTLTCDCSKNKKGQAKRIQSARSWENHGDSIPHMKRFKAQLQAQVAKTSPVVHETKLVPAQQRRCVCNNTAVTRVSTKPATKGQRFLACRTGNCKFFVWIDTNVQSTSSATNTAENLSSKLMQLVAEAESMWMEELQYSEAEHKAQVRSFCASIAAVSLPLSTMTDIKELQEMKNVGRAVWSAFTSGDAQKLTDALNEAGQNLQALYQAIQHPPGPASLSIQHKNQRTGTTDPQ